MSFFSKIRDTKGQALAYTPLKFSSPVNSQLSGTGIAESAISKHIKGRIRINGCWWLAFNVHNTVIRPGETIRVVGRSQLTLFIESVHTYTAYAQSA